MVMLRNEVPRSTDIVPSALRLIRRELGERLSCASIPAARALRSVTVSWLLVAAGSSPPKTGAARLRTVAAARPRAAGRTPFRYDLIMIFLPSRGSSRRSGGTGTTPAGARGTENPNRRHGSPSRCGTRRFCHCDEVAEVSGVNGYKVNGAG